MKEFLHHISETGLGALRQLIGEPFGWVYAPSVNVSYGDEELIVGNEIVVPSCSIMIDALGKYLTIANDWADTPGFMSYYLFEVSISDKLQDIASSPILGIEYPKSPFSTVSYGIAHPVNKIEILEYVEEGKLERVRYDRSIVFTRSKGKEVMFAADGTIAGLIVISTKPSDIEFERARSQVRVTLP